MSLNPFTAWLLSYALPASIAGGILFYRRHKPYNNIIIHGLLLLSILLSQYFIAAFGRSFPWASEGWPVIVWLASVIFSVLLIGKFGLIYSASAVVQELAMLSAAFLLYPSLPLPLIMLLILGFFVFSHELEKSRRFFKIALFGLGGILFLWLFSRNTNWLLIVSIHTVVGTILLRIRIIYSTGYLFFKNRSKAHD